MDGWDPAPSKCHEDVDHWVRHHPECNAVRGWMFWPPGETGRCRFMAHSGIEENGVLVDITPIGPNMIRVALVFLRHSGKEDDFHPMMTVCAEVLYPPFTWEEWHDSQTPGGNGEAIEIDL